MAPGSALPLGLAALLALTGCSLLPGTAQASEVEGSGYRFSVPDGWEESTERVRRTIPEGDVAVADTDTPSAFRDNLNVIVDPGLRAADLDEARAKFLEDLEGLSIDVRPRPDLDIDGAQALHHSAVATYGAHDLVYEQYGARHDQAWYVITFTFDQDTPRAERHAVMDDVLASWRWGD